MLGFKDKQADWLETHASTASRWGQRIVCQVVAQMQWHLFSFDVSAAFLKGVTLEEANAAQQTISGESVLLRVAHLDLPKESLHLVKRLKGYGSVQPSQALSQDDQRRLWVKGRALHVAIAP